MSHSDPAWLRDTEEGSEMGVQLLSTVYETDDATACLALLSIMLFLKNPKSFKGWENLSPLPDWV